MSHLRGTDILKVDAAKRRVYGIALEGNVADLQGDIVSDDELEDAAVGAITEGAVAGREHNGQTVGKLIASFPLTRELQKSLGIAMPAGRSAWLVGLEITDDDTWAAVKRGDYASLSIGGSALREPT